MFLVLVVLLGVIYVMKGKRVEHFEDDDDENDTEAYEEKPSPPTKKTESVDTKVETKTNDKNDNDKSKDEQIDSRMHILSAIDEFGKSLTPQQKMKSIDDLFGSTQLKSLDKEKISKYVSSYVTSMTNLGKHEDTNETKNNTFVDGPTPPSPSFNKELEQKLEVVKTHIKTIQDTINEVQVSLTSEKKIEPPKPSIAKEIPSTSSQIIEGFENFQSSYAKY
jgi:hypothetical protein